MSDARDDIRNLFQSQGLTGGYREFGERPAAPRPAAPPAGRPASAESERKSPKLDLVRSAPEQPQRPLHPLQGLFERLAESGVRSTPAATASDDSAPDVMHMPLADLFEHLESQGARP